jgi:uncharacterized protein YkwD
VLPRTRVPLATAAVILFAGLSVTAASSAPSKVNALPTLDQQVIAQINAVRVHHGLGRLHLSFHLRAASRSHSYDMARHGFFSHDSSNGTSPWSRLAHYYTSAGYSFWQVGETISYSPGADAAAVVRDWLTSPEHRAILLTGAFREIGVSAVHVTAASGDFHGDVTLVTADFGVRTR